MEGRGLLRVVSNQQLLQQEQAEAAARVDAERQREAFETSLSAHIRKCWERNKTHKRSSGIEKRLLDCLRAVKGEYDPETLAQIEAQGGSQIYMMLTATKVRAASAWIRDIMLPAADKSWGLMPTPIPDVPPEMMAIIIERVQQHIQQRMQAGEPIDPGMQAELIEKVRSDVRQAAKKRADEAAERMEELIDDQLTEGGWYNAMEEFVSDFCTFPNAFLKGPIHRRRRAFRWGANYQPEPYYEVRAEYERVSPFDCYPSPDALNTQSGDLIEHVRFTRGALYDLIGSPGYQEEAIRSVLQEYGRGGLREWLWNDGERAWLEGRGNALHDQPNTIDGLHFWGPAQGLMLLEMGLPPEMIGDPLAEYEVEAILVGRHVIRCQINDDPLARRPYHSSSFEKIPGSFWGTCPPERMKDIQRMCNATARALANNMGIASGPQVIAHVDQLADSARATLTEMYPWKVWQGKSHPTGNAGSPAFEFFQPDSNANELLAVFSHFERMADDATNIPRYMYGNERIGGAGNTASGLATLMDSSSKGIKGSIANIDSGVTEPAIDMLVFHNNVFGEDDSVKGDIKTLARGSSVLVAKDQAQRRRLEMLQLTANPMDMGIIGPAGRAKMLRETFKAGDLPDDIVPTQEEFEAQLAAQSEQPGPDDKKLELEERKLEQDAQIEQAKIEKDIAVAQIRYPVRGLAL